MKSNFENFFNLALDYCCVATFEGYFLHLNQAWANGLGWSLEELKSKPFLEFVHPDDQEKTKNVFTDVIAGKNVYRFQNRYLCKDNSYKSLSWSALIDFNAKLVYAIAVDKTDYNKALSVLEDVGRKFKKIYNHLPAASIIWRKQDDKIILENFNQSCLAFFSEFDFDNKTIEAANFFGVNAAILQDLTEQFDCEFSKTKEEKFIINSAEFKYVKYNLTKLSDHLVVSHFEDITEGVLANDLLETERANNLYAVKLAALGEMAGGVAHEINNPLAIINGKAMILQILLAKEKIDLTKVSEAVQIIVDTVARINKIINGLREFSRDAGKDPFESTNLKEFIKDATALTIERFNHAKIKFTQNEIAHSLSVEIKPTQFKQALMNILNNAYDAVLNQPSPWVKLETIVKDHELFIEVTNSGARIADEIAEKVFQPFFTTKDTGAGTGLGLSVASGTINSHNGTLYIDKNCLNTRFVIRIPVKQPTGVPLVA